MSRVASWLAAALIAAGVLGPAAAAPADGEAAAARERIVIAGGDLTEIAFRLGAGTRVVGVDTTSTWPPDAAALPQIGYLRRLSAEGVLSLAPDLFLAAVDAGPRIVLDQLRAAGVTVAVGPVVDKASEIPRKIAFVGEALDLSVEAEALAAEFSRELADVRAEVARYDEHPSVLFILSLRNGAPIVGGAGTSAARMIALAGGRNAASEVEGYKMMAQGAIIAAAPDIILMMRQHVEQTGGASTVRARPGIAVTPAGRAGRIVTMEGMKLLGFGLRTPAAVAELARLLHPRAEAEAGL